MRLMRVVHKAGRSLVDLDPSPSVLTHVKDYGRIHTRGEIQLGRIHTITG